jgi:hypothetical protein
VDDFTDAIVAFTEQFFKDRGETYLVLARETITMPSGSTAIDVLAEFGPGSTSNRIYVLARDIGIILDCETSTGNWEQALPDFMTIREAFVSNQ